MGGHVDDEVVNRRDGQDEVLVASLAAGLTYDAAGAAAGVSGRTVARRMTDPAFSARVSGARAERVSVLSAQLTDLGGEAIEVVRSCLHAPRPVDQLRAAHVVLSMIVRFRHQSDLEADVAEIKRHLADGTAEGGQ